MRGEREKRKRSPASRKRGTIAESKGREAAPPESLQGEPFAALVLVLALDA